MHYTYFCVIVLYIFKTVNEYMNIYYIVIIVISFLFFFLGICYIILLEIVFKLSKTAMASSFEDMHGLRLV